jgi:adenine-specific DNA-methyltransferase
MGNPLRRRSESVKGFEFYAVKDREMAREADFGLMIWDGKSVGTILNVLRLIRADKKAVLFNVADKQTMTFKTAEHWERFSSSFSRELRNDLQKRAAAGEWAPAHAPQQ